MNALNQIEHRPWPLPFSPWVMKQNWHELLFAHWPVRPEDIRPFIPEALELDVFEGKAWIGIVPFRMSGLRLRFPLPCLSAFPELNVRTYVVMGDKPGVYFFSLEASNPLAVKAGRILFHLPYMKARMSIRRNGSDIYYSSRRDERYEPPAEFLGMYHPISDPFFSRPGSLEHWLTERYCLYSVNRKRDIYRCEIHHPPWPLQVAEARILKNTLPLSHLIDLSGTEPLLYYAHELEVFIWKPKHLSRDINSKTIRSGL